MSGRLVAFARLTRPVFLTGGALLYGLGAATAVAGGAGFHLGRYLLGQALVTSVQLTTQYANEYFDLAADRAATSRTWLSGGSGVLVAGELAPVVAERAALAAAAVSVALGAVIVLVEPVVAAIGMVALLGGWHYSAPPARLVGSGWGEAAASLIVAVLTPLAGSLMLNGTESAALAWTAAALFPAHYAMLVALHLPDEHGDRVAGKRTIVVRLGGRAGRWLVPVLFAPAGAVVAWAGANGRIPPAAAWGAATGGPLAAAAGWLAVDRRRPEAWLTSAAVGAFALAAAGLAIGFLGSS